MIPYKGQAFRACPFFAFTKGTRSSAQTHNKLLQQAALIYQHTYSPYTFSWCARKARIGATPFQHWNLVSDASAY
jgi:hypothetical protein